eukprot:364174-Chlamydomonas_euryale.AAC.4
MSYKLGSKAVPSKRQFHAPAPMWRRCALRKLWPCAQLVWPSKAIAWSRHAFPSVPDNRQQDMQCPRSQHSILLAYGTGELPRSHLRAFGSRLVRTSTTPSAVNAAQAGVEGTAIVCRWRHPLESFWGCCLYLAAAACCWGRRLRSET